MSFRAVLDTNLVISAHKTSSHSSPSLEIIERWLNAEFAVLVTSDIIIEYIQKLQELKLPEEAIDQFLINVGSLAEMIKIETFHERNYPSDPDDIAFLLCAVNGRASHLITYDSDFDPVRDRYEFKVCAPIKFLIDLRAQLESGST